MFARRYPWLLITVAGLILLIAASRMVRLSELGMYPDEVWSVWQTFGTPAQIIQWTPYDWPPGYYLTLGLWRGLGGQHPIILRYLSVLAFLIGSSALFRVMRRLHNSRAAFIALPAYAALGYSILLTTEVRGYGLLMGMLPLAFWLTLRYFERPVLRRALPLALALAAMFYVSVTSIGAFLILGIYTLVVYRKQVWRWWLPGLAAGLLAAPEIVSKARVAVARSEATRNLTLPSLPEALRNLYGGYAGYDAIFLTWGVLFILATLYLLNRRPLRRSIVALFLWAFGAPLFIYFSHSLLGFFSLRYAWWIMLGIAIWTAWGAAYIPRPGMLATLALLSGMMFAPIPREEYTGRDSLTPLEANFIWLKDHLVTGDVFVADPNMGCGSPEEWDYFIRTYFPLGLGFVSNPEGYRRVWYVAADGRQDANVQAAVMKGRIPSRFVGPPECLFRLYEAPPDPVGILYENGMRFHGVDIMEGERSWSAPIVRHEGETVQLRLWWSVDRVPELDYSINTYLLRTADSLFVEVNGPPQLVYPERAPQETSRWQTGQYYVEHRTLTLPFPTGRGRIGLFMVVYDWGSGERVAAPGVDNERSLLLRAINVMSY